MGSEAAAWRSTRACASGRSDAQAGASTPRPGCVPQRGQFRRALRHLRTSRPDERRCGSCGCWVVPNAPSRWRVAVHLAGPGEPADDPSRHAMRLAAARLKSLLSGAGAREDELLHNILQQEPPLRRVMESVRVGSLSVAACVLMCWLCGNDPAGGADISSRTLFAGLAGLVAAMPVAFLHRVLWSPKATSQYTVLRLFTLRRAEYYQLWLSGLSCPQYAVILTMEALQMVSFFLPTVMGCIMSSTQLYSHLVWDRMGIELPEALPCGLGMMVSCVLFGMMQAGMSSPTPEERNAVMSAINNADRYYKVVSMSGVVPGARDSTLNSEAFKFVAQKWLQRNNLTSVLAGALGIADMLYLGVLWQLTGNLVTPMVVALVSSSIEVDRVLQQQQQGNGET